MLNGRYVLAVCGIPSQLRTVASAVVGAPLSGASARMSRNGVRDLFLRRGAYVVLPCRPASGGTRRNPPTGRIGWPGEHMLAIRHSIAVLVLAIGVAAGSDTTTEPSPGSEPATTDVGRIMFGRAPGGEVVEAEEIDLYVVNADGSEEQLLMAGAYPGRWSPDGSEVSIFCCDDGGAAHLLNPDTGEVRRLEQADPTLDSYCGAAWSPDGERLSCEAYGVDDPSLNGIYSVRASPTAAT